MELEITTLHEMQEDLNRLSAKERLDKIYEIAREYDQWVDHFTDKLKDTALTSEESFWVEQLMHSHESIVDMVSVTMISR